MQECRPVNTPYDKSSNGEDGSNAERPPMSPKDTTLFRGQRRDSTMSPWIALT